MKIFRWKTIQQLLLYFNFMNIRKYLLPLLIIVSINVLNAQNEANIWYFGKQCGLDFNSGTPIVQYNGRTWPWNSATICDTSGNLLFYTDSYDIYNRNHDIMENGSDIAESGFYGVAIAKLPGSENIYYVFSVADQFGNWKGFYYSIIDMNEDNGLGAVTEKNIQVESAKDAYKHITLVQQIHSDNVWVIVRKDIEDAFAAYLLNENGLSLNPVLCPIPDHELDATWGFLKVTYNKRYLFNSYHVPHAIEVCSFNATSGEIQYMYTLHEPGWIPYNLGGIEFSPDSKYLYLSFIETINSSSIYQFDMQYVNDEDQFNNSAMWIGNGHAFGLQLARDGKIYTTEENDSTVLNHYYLGMINKPWVRGPGSSYQNNILYMYPGEVEKSFPNILLDYLFRFQWEGTQCQGDTVYFIPNFIPTPESIHWEFHDFSPDPSSDELYPKHVFQNTGTYEVAVDVWYPSGRYEHTSREIEIYPTPHPHLGPDTIVCPGTSVTLYANCTADKYIWNNGLPGGSQYTVSDSGYYWVAASFLGTGCEGRDTIHVGWFPSTQIDESSLVITPTSCSGATGSLTGLIVQGSEPLSYLWQDLSGNVFGSGLQAFNLPAGQYFLTVTDTHGCLQISSTFTITDAGDLQVTQVLPENPHCFRPDGQLTILAFSPSGSILEYSIDDGNSYSPDSLFTGLPAGSYIVRVRDSNGCEGFFHDNPILLEDIPGPQVQQAMVTDETDGQQNGAIEITATANTPSISYSIDNGNTWQVNDGVFNNLQAGIYICVVKDQNDCDTTFTLEIQNIILTYLQAISGSDDLCLHEAASVPILVENFNSVATFQLRLSYDKSNLLCLGYTDVNPQLASNFLATVDTSMGEITLTWQDNAEVTLPEEDTIVRLVFDTRQSGQGIIEWFTGASDSYFTNLAGSSIPAQYHTGEVTIYEPPYIVLINLNRIVCQGEMTGITGFAVGEHEPFSYQWTYPDGHQTSSDPFFISVSPNDAGDYTLLVTDNLGCTDQKTVHLEVSLNPVAAFHGTDTLTVDSGYLLDAGAGMSHYLWNTGDTTNSIEVFSEGWYSVNMESSAGCLGTDSVFILLFQEPPPPPPPPPQEPAQELYLPNSFTPDGNGLNDVFRAVPASQNITAFNMLIYDRWGTKLFETSDIAEGWDGTKNGKPCTGGVYVYKVSYRVMNPSGAETQKELTGTVALVR
jgi:gliding motility-associated-like protein